MKRSYMFVRHKATGEDALAMRAPSGCVLVQFNNTEHPQAYGWHLYPRHHFVRRNGSRRLVKRLNHIQPDLQQVPMSIAEAKRLRQAFRDQHPSLPRDWSAIEQRIAASYSKAPDRDGPEAPYIVGNQAGWYP